MFRRIVVGVDGSRPSEIATSSAITLAARDHADLYLVSVVEELPTYISAREETSREAAEAQKYFGALHARLGNAAARHGIAVQSRVLVGNEARQLLDELIEVQADLLAIGHAGHSAVWGSALGSTALQLLRHAPCSILIVRAPTPMATNGRLAVALDGSPLGWEAFAAALDLGGGSRHPLHVFSVAEDIPPSDSRRPQAHQLADSSRSWQAFLIHVQARAAARAASAGVPIEVSTQTGPASEALIAAARDISADLLILGATGQERPWAQTTGGTAIKIAEEAPCDVLVVRPRVTGTLVRDIMVPGQSVSQPDSPATQVLAMLIEGETRLVPVVGADGTLEGVITLGLLLRRADSALATHLVELRSPAHVREHLDQLVAGKQAQDFMLRRPYVLQPDVPVAIAGRYLTAHRITRAPVVDPARHFLGILGEREVISALVMHPGGDAEQEVGSAAGPASAPADVTSAVLTAGSLVDTRVPRLPESASLDEVVTAIQATASGVVLVIGSDQRALGLVDDHALLRDAIPEEATPSGGHLLRALARSSAQALRMPRGAASEPRTAASLVRLNVPVLRADLPIADALARIIADGTSDLAIVVAPDGLPLGILRRHTALRALVRG